LKFGKPTSPTFNDDHPPLSLRKREELKNEKTLRKDTFLSFLKSWESQTQILFFVIIEHTYNTPKNF
jgi:hypothetical protein